MLIECQTLYVLDFCVSNFCCILKILNHFAYFYFSMCVLKFHNVDLYIDKTHPPPFKISELIKIMQLKIARFVKSIHEY